MSSGEGFEPLVETLKLPDPDDRHVYACVQRIAESRRNPPEGAEDVLAHMERSGLRRSAGALRLGPGAVLQMTDDDAEPY